MAQVQEVAWNGKVAEYLGDRMIAGRKYPAGMGSLEFRETKKAGPHIVRFTANGRFKFAVILRKEGLYIFHADFGYRKKSDQEMTPLEKIRDRFRVPKASITIGWKEPVEFSEFSADIRRAYPEGSKTDHHFTDGQVELLAQSLVRDYGHCCETREHLRVCPGSVFIRYHEYVGLGGRIFLKVSYILIEDETEETLKVLERGLEKIFS